MEKLLRNIKGVVFDVDGTMTDGTITLGSEDKWERRFSVIDGVGIINLVKAGYTIGVITAADAYDIRFRIKFLGIKHFYEKSSDKLKDLQDFLEKTNLSLDEVCYIGDDLADLEVLNKCGFSVAPPNSVREVKETAKLITQSPGGKGAVRELCDILLKYGYHNLC